MTKFNSFFVKQTSFDVDYAPTHITKWKSQRTGLQITYINQPSPIVNGYFAVATEIENSSGCPHTLEHLIFMGSKKYPYKGLLDSLGNRLYSSTNAWTSVDQTVYTLTTAGWDGFKTLLPIYLDHLFNPTLTDEACLTEVYHIDGNGKEKGVVFSEMQGIENQSWFISFQKMQELLYSKTSGYSSETGGLMSELRNLSNEQIKQFHKSMYRPDNLCVIITGSIDQDELLNIMTEFDNELPEITLSKRPFVDSVHDGPLQETVVQEVEFPEQDESMGELLISWIGPNGNDTLINVAIDMIGSYFTDSPISLFNKHLIEIKNPLATDVDYTTDDYYNTAINFSFNGVPTEKLSELDLKIKELIKSQIASNNIDLNYMKQVVNQQKLKYISSAEKSSSIFQNIATLEFIYGNRDGSDLSKWAKDLNEYDTLLNWTAQQWSEVIDQYFVTNHSATILGKPSNSLNEHMKLEDKKLRKEILSRYGESGLKQLQEKLDLAQLKNDTPIPDEILNIAKPDPSKIAFIKTNSYRVGKLNTTNAYLDNETIIKDTPEDFPLYIHFEDFKSQFTTIQLVMSSTKIQPELLKYMSIIEEIFSMSLMIDDTYVSYENVISDLNEDMIEYHLDNGYDSQFLELITINVKFETKKYKKIIKWLYDITQNVLFEENRIKIIIEKHINSLADKKRNGELMMYSSQYRNLFNANSLRKAQDAMYTETFYKDLLEDINEGKFETVKKDLDTIKSQLFTLENIKVLILGNINNIEDPVSSWKTFTKLAPPINQIPFDQLPRSFQFKSDLGMACRSAAHLIEIPAADSTHFISLTSIPTDYLDEDIFRIALTSEFLSAVEGPFWRGIRGTGLAYGVNIRRNIETGYLTFNLYRSSDAIKAWRVSKEIVDRFANEEVEIDDLVLENAIATIINELANVQENTYDAATFKISDNLFKRRGPNYIKYFIKQLNLLKKEDVIYTLKKYFIKLFDSKNSVIFTSLPSDQVEDMGNFLQKQGYNIYVQEINAGDESDFESETDSESE
ncbi:unnamed protein product [Candida verbasci]|uniref:Zinc metalloprotease n=1 Tax=Candida verbasci TaxID=1227364 RepID=A0A9W4TZE1_9ASCO|nr:unnamed protein product [Candida verbasci]